MAWRWVALCTVAALAAGAMFVAAGAPAERPEWHETAPPPLAPREYPTGFWTGEEVILVGGSDAPPCPPNASCEMPSEPPLADGAAYDPETDTWRTIADAPVRFSWAQPLVLGSTAYLWIAGDPGRPQAPSAFLAYRIDEDRWEELDMPTDDPGWYELVAAGDRIVAVSGSDEEEERPAFVYDPSSSEWSELPADPFSPGYDRVGVWDGEDLLVFDHDLADLSGDAPLRGAAFDFGPGRWRVLEDPEAAWRRVGPVPVVFPPPPDEVGEVPGTTEVAAGDDRFLFLGSSWPEGDEDGELHARAWLAPVASS